MQETESERKSIGGRTTVCDGALRGNGGITEAAWFIQFSQENKDDHKHLPEKKIIFTKEGEWRIDLWERRIRQAMEGMCR